MPVQSISKIQAGSNVYMMGICGTAMASLAGLLKQLGYNVFGSDSNPYPPMSTQIESLGIKIDTPYSEENLKSKKIDFVVVGNVISKGNPEMQWVEQAQLPYSSLPQVLGDLILSQKHSIVISGTHGKTTTTSLVSWIFSQAEKQPGYLIGGIAKNFSKSFEYPQGDHFVIEGDEYDTAFFDKVPKFTHYHPKSVILTSVEFDHADIYKDLDDVKNAFKMLMHKIPSDGTLIYCSDDANIQSILDECKCKNKIPYGFKNALYTPQVLKVDESGTRFQVRKNQELLGVFEMPLTGDYNVLNATSAIAMAVVHGIKVEDIQKALKTFEGIKRRQEVLGEPNGVLVIEDFAHHPTAVAATLKGVKNKYNGRKLLAVFEPRSATSRRKIFQQDYVKAFTEADLIYLAEAFDQTKISETDRFSSQELCQDLSSLGKSAHCYAQVEDIVAALKKDAKAGDMIVIMSNGGFGGIYQKLLSVL